MKPRASAPQLYDHRGMPLALTGAWKGASTTRRQTAGWSMGVAGSADEDLLDDLPKLRSRSRQLLRDNPLATGAINTACTSTVATGLTLRCEVDREILGWDEGKAIAWQKRTERLYDMHCRSKTFDLTLTQNGYEMQDLAFRTVLESGDALAIFTYRKHPSSPFGSCVQIVEGDRICNRDNMPDTQALTAGVNLDTNGAATAFDVLNQHPGARLGLAKKTWAPAVQAFSESGRRLCQHLFVRLRPDQHRGAPYLAPVIESLKELGEYTDGELRAAVVSGLYTVFIGRKTPIDPDTGEPTVSTAPDGSREYELGYGTVLDLDDDETLSTATPGRPNQAFDPFVLAILRQIGVALELPYEILIKHFTASYSAARAALLELGKFVRRRRAWLAANFCQPAYEAWLEEAIASGYVEAPGFFEDPLLRMAYCGTKWVGDSLGQIDIKKEAEGWKVLKDEFGIPESEAVDALTGGDWDRNIEIRGYEERTKKEQGLKPPEVPAPGQPAPSEPDPNPDQPDQEDLPS